MYRRSIYGGMIRQSTFEKLRMNIRSVLSKNVLTGPGDSALQELEKYHEAYYLRSLLYKPEIMMLHLLWKERIKSNTQCALTLAIESRNVYLNDEGTGTGPIDIYLKSQTYPFEEFGALPYAMSPETTKSVRLSVFLSYMDLQILFALYLNNPSIVKASQKVQLKCDDGDVQVFAAIANAHFQTNVALRETVLQHISVMYRLGTFFSIRVVQQLLHKLVSLECGEYSYFFSTGVDKLVKAQHKAVLVRNDGLMVEVIAVRSWAANTVRPTSFVSFMERAIQKPAHLRYGILKQYYTHLLPNAFIVQRAIQFVGPYDYELLSQNCFTFSRWVCENTWICNDENESGRKPPPDLKTLYLD